MTAIRLLPIILSLLLLAAHFYRAGLLIVAVLCIALPFGLLLRQTWIPRLFQVVLVLGALEWLRALYGFVTIRIAFGEPWLRLAIILVAVALLTGLSGLVFKNRALRDYYGNKSGPLQS